MDDVTKILVDGQQQTNKSLAEVLSTVAQLNSKIDALSVRQSEREKQYVLREEHFQQEITGVKEDAQEYQDTSDDRFETIETTLQTHDKKISKMEGIGIAIGVLLTVLNIGTSFISIVHYFPSLFK
ncbi:hypothetical protein AB840_03770 [Megasphaera cerevisiae DSM 20462]|uniref:Uncharacterized protein n=1 Tax=Megasphaera cerevisiae DSM 20462 TaxID=1122219 RepID=A0A0J6WZ61_9FIRM|nr:hypothetical protein [Megasphaera cerevisiae]KMO87162.1 hypothetical protein AB840_03770 [Megasphaera cerevisiae DSM 20462]SJZ59346.1 hypothetical protein SAMN05660900_00882 [Megasphaera cerevisiae DSM 20462]